MSTRGSAASGSSCISARPSAPFDFGRDGSAHCLPETPTGSCLRGFFSGSDRRAGVAMEPKLENLTVLAQELLVPPERLKRDLPLSDAVRHNVQSARQTVRDILQGADHRMLVIVGPCSIHDPHAALEYATRLRALAADVDDALFLVMRAYFEKPRRPVGGKGLINDPQLDDTFHIEEGLAIARRLLIDIASLGVPLSTEALDPTTPPY